MYWREAIRTERIMERELMGHLPLFLCRWCEETQQSGEKPNLTDEKFDTLVQCIWERLEKEASDDKN